MIDDFLNIKRLEKALQQVEGYMQNVAKPALQSESGQEILTLKQECEHLRQRNNQAAERVQKLMITLKDKGVV